MADQKMIAVSEAAKEAIKRLKDLKRDVPNHAEMMQTSGEGDGPAYRYHQAMTRVGQYASAQVGEHLEVMSVMETWMSESIAALEQTNEEAAAMLRSLSGELEGFAAEHVERGHGATAIETVTPESHGGINEEVTEKWGGTSR